MVDWSQCPDLESVPDRCGGAWVVKGTRVMVECILDNHDDGFSAEEIGGEEFFPWVGVERARRIIEFARAHHHNPA